MNLTKKSLLRQEIKNISPKIILDKRISDQIDYLHSKIGGVEWSGPLFYRVEGSIKDPANMIITLVDILPMNKGTTGYTEYTTDETVMDKWLELGLDCKIGHIHTHHSMGTFFSGTDWSELEDNAPNHNYYLSLITNFKREDIAKLCFIAKIKSEVIALDDEGQGYNSKVEEEKLVVYDCKIEKETVAINVDDSFKEQVEKICNKKPTYSSLYSYSKPSIYTKSNKPSTGGKQLSLYEDEWEQFQEVSQPYYLNTKKSDKTKNDNPDILYSNITENDAEDFVLDLMRLNYVGLDAVDNTKDIIKYFIHYGMSPESIKGEIQKECNEIFEWSLYHCRPDNSDPLAFQTCLVYARDYLVREESVNKDKKLKPYYKAFIEGIQLELNKISLN